MRRQRAPFPWVLVIVGVVVGFVILGAAGVWVGLLIGERQNANRPMQPRPVIANPAWNTPRANPAIGPLPAPVTFREPRPLDADQKQTLTLFFTNLCGSL